MIEQRMEGLVYFFKHYFVHGRRETEDRKNRVIVLTLCTYDVENSRFLLVGKITDFEDFVS